MDCPRKYKRRQIKEDKQTNKQIRTRGLNFHLWAERRAHNDARSLQSVHSHPALLCAVSSVHTRQRPSARPAKGRHTEKERA